MKEQADRQQDGGKPGEDVPPVRVSEPLSASPQKTATETELKIVEREMSGFERSTLRWTRATFIILAVTCVFIAFQWSEMRSGSNDTHNLAVAATKQAGELSNVSDAAAKIRQAAQDMVVQDQRIADNAKASLDANSRQNSAALNATVAQYRLDQRAWITVEVGEKTGNFAVAMRNTGKTPAINVSDVTVFSVTDRIGPPDVDLAQNSSSPIPVPTNAPQWFIESLKKEGAIRNHPPTGYVIAPGDSQISSDYQGKFSQILGWDRNNPRNRAYIQGRVKYDDIFEVTHQTDYCFWYASPSDFVMCNDHNKMN